MFCPECGTKLDDGVKFCIKCGTFMKPQSDANNNTVTETETTGGPFYYKISNDNGQGPYSQTNTVTLQPLNPKGKPAGLKLVSVLVAAVVMIGLVAGGFFLLPKLLMPRANNCVAVTLESIMNMSKVSSFEYKMTASSGGDNEVGLKGYLYLGKDLYGSVFEMEPVMDDVKGRLIFYDGCYGYYGNYSWGDEYTYIDRETIIENLESSLSPLNIDPDDLKIDLNKFVKDGKINIEEIKRINDEVSKKLTDYLDENGLSDYNDYFNNYTKLSEEAIKLFQNFLFVECEKEDFLNKFVSGLNITNGDGGSKTYDYTIKLSKLMTAVAEYVIKSIDKYPEIKRALKDLAADQDMDLDELFDKVLESLDEAADNIASEGLDKIKISVTVTKNRLIQKFSLSYKDQWDNNIFIKFTIDNHNKLKVDFDSVKKFMKKAEDNKDSYSSSSDLQTDYDWDDWVYENTEDNRYYEETEGPAVEDYWPTQILPELPAVDYGGRMFSFLTYQGFDGSPPYDIVSMEENGDVLNDAVYRRNRITEEKYNINIKMYPYSEDSNILKKTVYAGDSMYDAVLMRNINIPGNITSGLLTDVRNLPYINLDKPWWDPAVSALSVCNKNYLLGGDIILADKDATNALLFNKMLFMDFGLENPYQLVYEGRWTMDMFQAMCKGVARDLNGDGKMTPDDSWGLICRGDALHALFVSGSGVLAGKDENDIPYIDFASPRNLAVMDKAMDIMYDKFSVLNVSAVIDDYSKQTESYLVAVTGSRALFAATELRDVTYFRAQEPDFGILPMPKFDERQESYCSAVNPYGGALIGVPPSAWNFDMTGVILEAMAAESRYTVIPAYYDVMLRTKFYRDDESCAMLDIIFASKVYDVGAFYDFGGVYSGLIAMCNKSDANIMSYYEKNIAKMEKDIVKTVDNIEGFD